MQKIEHTSHAGINFEPNKKLGYYLVGNEIYYNKIQALITASKMNLQIRWFFNEDVFVKFPWHIEPEESLRELYRQRAQQLREQYDYIRLELSGGSDSTTVAYSFLLNDIHLDEVIFRYPKAGERGVSGDPKYTGAENTLSEWEFAAKPLLNWIATNYPKTKITVHDYSEDMIAEADSKDESWIFRTRHYLQPGHIHKFDDRHIIEHRRQIDQTNKMCLLYGVDKPKIFIKDDKFFFYFQDGLASYTNEIAAETSGVVNEFFYWAPECTKLIAKQVHEVKRWFSMPQNYQIMSGTLQWPNSDFAKRTLYESLVKRIVYPDYDFHTFQTAKPTNNIWNEMDYWFHTNFKDTRLYNSWEAGIGYLLDNLDSRFTNKDIRGITDNIEMFNSVYYYFGDIAINETVRPSAGFKTKSLLKQHRKEYFERPHRHCIHGKIVIY
jgi:hypothetical protein